jgi:hypothetical protein
MDQGGRPIFNVDSGPLFEVMAKIEHRTSYGETASGRYLCDEFDRDPFGWDFEAVRLFVVSLLRAGKIEATSKGQLIESITSVEAQNTFINNNLFRQASFRPKVGLEFIHLIKAGENFKAAFGKEIPVLEQGTAAGYIRTELGSHEEELNEMRNLMVSRSLPGVEVIQDAINHIHAIRTGKEDQAILEFNTSFKEIKEAIKRVAELMAELTEPHLYILERAKKSIRELWPFLRQETDLPEDFAKHAEILQDLLERETFYREFPDIEKHCRALEEEYQNRYRAAAEDRSRKYEDAVRQLEEAPGWSELRQEQRQVIIEPLVSRASAKLDHPIPVPTLRADADAAQARLEKAVKEMMLTLEGERIVEVKASKFFKGGIETEEQLESALKGLREECEPLIGAGKKILVN